MFAPTRPLPRPVGDDAGMTTSEYAFCADREAT